MKECLNHGLNGLKDDTDSLPSEKSAAIKSVQSTNPCPSVIQTTGKLLNHGFNGLKDDTDSPPLRESAVKKSVRSNNPYPSVIQTGYKQTEVGVIPEEWVVKSLLSVSEKIMVGIASAATHAYRDKGIVLLRNQNIKIGYLDDTEVLYITPAYESLFKNKRLKSGDLLTARTGYPGTTCVVPEEYESAQSFTTLITRPNKELIDSIFLCYYINSEHGQSFFEHIQIGGAQKNVNAGSLQKMSIPVLPLSEQRAIAAALSDVDALIASLNTLIAKKRDLKQATMQQLLTGKQRLPGFSGEWEVRPLGEVVDKFVNGGTPSTQQAEYWTGWIPWITGADIVNQQVTEIRRYITDDAVQKSSTNVVVKGNLLLVSRTGVGKLAIAPFDVAISQDFTGVYVRQDRLIPEFLFRYFDYNSEVLQSQNQGTSIKGITRETITSIKIPIPQLAEQTAIAAVLSDMDAEIAALEARRDKTRLLKQGMMQELLTGRIRLV